MKGLNGVDATPSLARRGTGELPDEANEPNLTAPPQTDKLYTAAGVRLQRWMRFNPLRTLTPENLSVALDQFDIGILRQAALYWDAMARRDDTLCFVKPQLENSIAGKPWGVFMKAGADPVEAARHKTALEFFYNNLTATDAFDRNQRGGRWKLLKQMGEAHAYMYVVHHFVWEPQAKMLEVAPVKVDGVGGGTSKQPKAVPAITATLEKVPLQYFENVSGTLRFLPFGGFGLEGTPLDWDNEWMCTTGEGIMFAASISYVFKRLSYQDWTVFNERYAQSKVVGKTNAAEGTPAYAQMERVVREFNSDMAIVIGEWNGGAESPIELLGPEGTASVDLFERFLDRQDRKLTVMFRGSDLRNMSREKDTTGVSAQSDETEALELAHCRNIADAARQCDRRVIRYCFGEGVEPLAYFGLPDMDEDNAADLRESAGFLADRGAMPDMEEAAARLGVTLTDDPEKALKPVGNPQVAGDVDDEGGLQDRRTGNARLVRLQQLVEETLRTQNAEDGRWVTMHGRHVFLKEGQSVEEALQAVTHEDNNDPHEKSVPSLLTLRDPGGKAHNLTVAHDGHDWVVKNSEGQTLPRKFGSRESAKSWAQQKLGPEINRRYEAAAAAGTLPPVDPIRDTDARDRRMDAEREEARKQSAGIAKLAEEHAKAARLADRARKKAPMAADEQREIIRGVVGRHGDASDHDGEDFGAVSETAVSKASAAGHDIAGFTKRIEPDAVRHVLARHADQATEMSRNQVPVTTADFERLPEVYDEPDNVLAGEPDPDGSPTLFFEKKLGENFRALLHVRRGKRRLAFKSLTKERTPAAS